MRGQEKQIFMGFVLNLQSHVHNTTDSQKYHSCREAGEQFMSHRVCPWLITRSNAGSQWSSGRAAKLYGLPWGQKDHACYRILWNQSPSPFALWGSRDFNSTYEHKPGTFGWSCWKRRKKNLLGLPCHYINNLSQAPSGLDQIGKWVTGTVSTHWVCCSVWVSSGSWCSRFVDIHVVPSSSLLTPPHSWGELPFLQVHQSYKWTSFTGT